MLKKKEILSRFIENKYTEVICLKAKNRQTLTQEFQKIIKESNHKSEKHGLTRTVNFIIAQ